MTINEVIFMQLRVARLFSKRLPLKINEVNQLFIDNKIYDFISDCYDTYHCGSDEIVYNDVLDILEENGRLGLC